jgi:hypothetical protein
LLAGRFIFFGFFAVNAPIASRRVAAIRRDVARYNQQTGKWEWGEPPKKPKTWEVQ